MLTLAILSDLHLSHTHGFFWDNWRRARDAVNAAAPDLVVINGDLCINGPDVEEELAFAARALMRVRAETLALPGNHDVGDEPPGQDPAQLITVARLDAWHRQLGPDRFCRDLGAWRVIGLNAQLFGSGLPDESAQDAWLASEIASAPGPVALILHKPIFLSDPGEDAATISSLNSAPRARLLALLADGPVRLVVSGHLHASRDVLRDGIRYVWAPATAFLGAGGHGGTPALGGLLIDLSEEEPRIEPLPVDGLVAHDLAAIKGHGRYAFLRDMPPSPPPDDA